MKTRKLSMNSQLIELRSAGALVKSILPDAIAIDEQKGTTLQSSLKEVIYSLRDAQYAVRGQKEAVRRSAQLRSMKIPEIRSFVNALIDKIPPYPRALSSDLNARELALLNDQELAFRNSAVRVVEVLRQVFSKLEAPAKYHELFIAPRENEAEDAVSSIVAAVEDVLKAKAFIPKLEDIEAIRDSLVQKYVKI